MERANENGRDSSAYRGWILTIKNMLSYLLFPQLTLSRESKFSAWALLVSIIIERLKLRWDASAIVQQGLSFHHSSKQLLSSDWLSRRRSYGPYGDQYVPLGQATSSCKWQLGWVDKIAFSGSLRSSSFVPCCYRQLAVSSLKYPNKNPPMMRTETTGEESYTITAAWISSQRFFSWMCWES